MEALLMDDDSSSGESDNEVEVPKGNTTAATSSVTEAAPSSPAPPVAAPAPASGAPSAGGSGGGTSQAVRMAMLKSLYKSGKSSGGAATSSVNPTDIVITTPTTAPPVKNSAPSQKPMQPSVQRPSQQQPQQQMQQNYSQQQQYGRQQQPQQQKQQQQPTQQQNLSFEGQNITASQQRQRSQPMPPPQEQHMQQGGGNNEHMDPFAPTPLAQIKRSHETKQRHQQQQPQYRQPQQQVQHQQQPSSLHGQPSSHHQQMQRNSGSGHHHLSSSSSRPPTSSGQSANDKNKDNGGLTPEQMQELVGSYSKKAQFFKLTKILVKYLEQKDKTMNARVKNIIEEHARRRKQGQLGSDGITEGMQKDLRALVGEKIWKKATEYLAHMIREKREALLKAMTTEQRAEFHRKRQEHIQQQQSLVAASQQHAIGAPAPAPTMDHLMRDIHKQREKIAIAMPGQPQVAVPPTTTTAVKTTTTTMAADPSGTSVTLAPTPAIATGAATTAQDKSGKKTVRRKSGSGASTTGPSQKMPTGLVKDPAATGAATGAATAPNASRAVVVSRQQLVAVEEPPREYEEFMDLIENAVDYEWPSILELLGNNDDLNISNEERHLLYDTSTVSSLTIQQDQKKQGMSNAHPQTGWSHTNILSARNAWARVRLKEQRRLAAEGSHNAPSLGGGVLTLSSASRSPHQLGSPSSGNAQALKDMLVPANTGAWVNDETAEQDKALALLSEGTQMYLKGVLEKAIQCARQRQNLDGIRLWHQQYAALPLDEKKDGSNSEEDLLNKPLLSLRLGCDVPRQIAQAQGNAAMTCKRMEEALERQVNVPSRARAINVDTLCEASSMGEIALKPLLRSGVEKADLQAKRSFEVYGGKNAKDPPFGQVPKRGKLEVEDFLMGSRIQLDKTHFHKASSASGFLSF